MRFIPDTNLDFWSLVLNHLSFLAYLSSLWIPLVFLAYAVGARRVGLRYLFAFALIEGIAVALGIYLYRGPIYL